ncbi:class I SAM-dependent methyltransferase [Herbidospora yilanensis]|uniref:class I SAM-dependent methyltransferase n=1 Tax=Herbidospora yilanensis TaxID=354426 RepID=UPI000A814575|nr:class I SAM-dependent methyltransferase [Herbidospora yilanensis]
MTASLTIRGAWSAARENCAPGCFCYHASWRLFRQAGLKGNPRWHTAFYQRALAERQPSTALVCGSSDETMPQILTELQPGMQITVADACPTPLTLINTWAKETGTQVFTLRSEAPELAGVSGSFDLIVTDGLLSLLPSPADREAVITRLAGLLSEDGLLLYTSRIAGRAGYLEYDRIGRAGQALAATTWPATSAERMVLARQRLRHPSRPSPFASPDQIADAFRNGFGQVRLFTRSAPPTVALALHPAFLIGRGSVCVGIAATQSRRP